MATLLKGPEVAQAIIERARSASDELRAKDVKPTLAILRLGEREDDLSYERGAIKRCAEADVDVRSIVLDEDAEQARVIQAIEDLNADPTVHGILMFRPLPAHIDEKECCEAIDPAKDVDAATKTSLAGVFTGSDEGFAPCTAQACMEILRHFGIDVSGKRAAVLGRSLVIGKPVSMMLMASDATTTTCHSKTEGTPDIARDADIVIVATGKMESIGAEHFREGQTVIDVGMHWNDDKGRLCGDVAFEEVEPIVERITPVPGGVGSVTTAMLVDHVVLAAERQTARSQAAIG